MSTVIKRNTSIPTKQTESYTTVEDNQTEVPIAIYEGERVMTKDNNILGEFTLSGIPPVPREVPDIKVTFEVDANSILNVTAVDMNTGRKNNITIIKNTGSSTHCTSLYGNYVNRLVGAVVYGRVSDSCKL